MQQSEETMNSKEVEAWLNEEVKNKNSLAQSYLSLLENATPEMREHWFQMLGTILKAVNDSDNVIKMHK